MECVFLSLMQRAKLFVKLYYQAKCKRIKDSVRNLKFKKQPNVTINEATLPTKTQLIKILREDLFVEHQEFRLPGVKSIKERLILILFIYHKILGKHLDTFTDRSALFETLKRVYPDYDYAT